MQRERRILQEDVIRQRGAHVEMRRGVTVDEHSIARGKMAARVLNRGIERVPVERLRWRFADRRERRIEVIHFEVPVDAKL